MSRVGIGASGGAWPIDPSMARPAYFMPQGVSADLIATKYGFSRDDVDAYAVREPEARRDGLGRGPLQQVGRAGEGRQRPHHPRPATSTCVPRPTCSRSAQLKPSFAMMGEMGGFDARRRAGASRRSSASTTSTTPAIRPASSTAPRAVLVGIKEGGPQGRPEAARKDPRLRQYRLRAGHAC